jgi:hypothetical protein
MYAPRRFSGAISAMCADMAGKSIISPNVQMTTVAMTPLGDAMTPREPKPIANSMHPIMSDRAFGQCAVAVTIGTSSATISNVLMVNSIP